MTVNPIITIAMFLSTPMTLSKAKAGAYRTIPMYRIICREYAIDAESRAYFPNLFSRYWKNKNYQSTRAVD